MSARKKRYAVTIAWGSEGTREEIGPNTEIQP